MATAAPATVLIADDDLLFARSVQILLEDECGCRVVLSSSADDVMDRLAEPRSFDAFIVDLGIFDSRGLLLGRLRRHEQDGMKVVVMTAHHAVLDAARVRHVDAAAFLSKPIDPVALLDVVRSAMTSENRNRASQPSSLDGKDVS